jgi:hypothetical protein
MALEKLKPFGSWLTVAIAFLDGLERPEFADTGNHGRSRDVKIELALRPVILWSMA